MQIAHKIVQGKDKKKIWFTIVQKYFAQTVQAIKFSSNSFLSSA